METIVAGPRDFLDKSKIFKALDRHHQIYPISLLIHGGAPGVDSIADEWAKFNEVPTLKMKADWDFYGKGAGPIRNREMAEIGRRLCVIRNKISRGTNDMIQAAKEKNIPINEYDV